VFEAGCFVREPLEKLVDGEFSGEIVLVHVNNLVYNNWRVNRIIDNGSRF
jgi:hypothetical protein